MAVRVMDDEKLKKEARQGTTNKRGVLIQHVAAIFGGEEYQVDHQECKGNGDMSTQAG